jgi:hypothetical protein
MKKMLMDYIRSHCTKDNFRKNRNNFLLYCWNPFDVTLSLKHWRCDGKFIQVRVEDFIIFLIIEL